MFWEISTLLTQPSNLSGLAILYASVVGDMFMIDKTFLDNSTGAFIY